VGYILVLFSVRQADHRIFQEAQTSACCGQGETLNLVVDTQFRNKKDHRPVALSMFQSALSYPEIIRPSYSG